MANSNQKRHLRGAPASKGGEYARESRARMERNLVDPKRVLVGPDEADALVDKFCDVKHHCECYMPSGDETLELIRENPEAVNSYLDSIYDDGLHNLAMANDHYRIDAIHSETEHWLSSRHIEFTDHETGDHVHELLHEHLSESDDVSTFKHIASQKVPLATGTNLDLRPGDSHEESIRRLTETLRNLGVRLSDAEAEQLTQGFDFGTDTRVEVLHTATIEDTAWAISSDRYISMEEPVVRIRNGKKSVQEIVYDGGVDIPASRMQTRLDELWLSES